MKKKKKKKLLNWAEKFFNDDKNLTLSRLHLMSATKQVIKNGLNILNISAPEKM